MSGAPTNSATLVAPIGLESSLRNGQTDDFASLVRSYHEVWRTAQRKQRRSGNAKSHRYGRCVSSKHHEEHRRFKRGAASMAAPFTGFRHVA